MANLCLSLSLVPLLYWYNHRGQFLRSLLYGFLYWLFKGSEKEIRERKLVFSLHRDRVEYVLFEYKQEIAALAAMSGTGLKATRAVDSFFDQLIYFLNENKGLLASDIAFEHHILELTKQKRKDKSVQRAGRTFTKRDQSQSNIKELYDCSVRCHICNGIVNLKYGGIQYDHVLEYKTVKITDPVNMKPTHPFCNNLRSKIEEYKSTHIKFNIKVQSMEGLATSTSGQLSFWGQEEFPA